MTNDISKEQEGYHTGRCNYLFQVLYVQSTLLLSLSLFKKTKTKQNENKHLEQGFGYRGIVCPLEQGKPLVSKR